ncbi:hypothetical protein ScPMuIL_004679 [Solemya velum]
MAVNTSSFKVLLAVLIPFVIPSIKFTTSIKKNIYDEEKKQGNRLMEVGEMMRKKSLFRMNVMVIQNPKIRKQQVEDCTSSSHQSVRKHRLIPRIHRFVHLLCAYRPLPIDLKAPSVSEIITWVWTGTLVIENIRQIVSRDDISLKHKLQNWMSGIWNRFDLVIYLCFILAVVLRFTLYGENFVYARLAYSLTIGIQCSRFMRNFFVAKNVGPKVIMIRNMMLDLWFFFLILAVFIVSFGICYRAIIFPNSPANWKLVKDVVYFPYWQIYGELFLDNMEGVEPSTCSHNRTIWHDLEEMERCPEPSQLVPLLAGVYMILTNILLVNLLIAMFSYTFQRVQNNSETVWKYYRYGLVNEFHKRPTLIPPLIIVNHLYRLGKLIYSHFKTIHHHNEFKQRLNDKQNTYLSLFERAAMEDYLNIHHIEQQQQLQTKVATTADRIEKVIQDIEQIKNEVQGLDVAGKKKPDTDDAVLVSSLRSPSGLKKTVQTSIDELARQNLEQDVKLEQLMELMELVLHQQALFLANAKEKENQDSMFTSGI